MSSWCYTFQRSYMEGCTQLDRREIKQGLYLLLFNNEGFRTIFENTKWEKNKNCWHNAARGIFLETYVFHIVFQWIHWYTNRHWVLHKNLHSYMPWNIGLKQNKNNYFNKRSVLRRQSRDTNRNTKRSVYCMSIRIVWSNVSSIGPSSERDEPSTNIYTVLWITTSGL